MKNKIYVLFIIIIFLILFKKIFNKIEPFQDQAQDQAIVQPTTSGSTTTEAVTTESPDDIIVRSGDNIPVLVNKTIINGDVTIYDIDDISFLREIVEITGNLSFIGTTLTNLEGLSSLERVEGGVNIDRNYSLVNLYGLNSLTSVGANLDIINNSLLTNLEGLNNLTSVGGGLVIQDNGGLINLVGLNSLTSVGRELVIDVNSELINLVGLNSLTSVGAKLSITHNDELTNLVGLNSLTSVGQYLNIEVNEGLINLDGLNSLTSVGGDLVILENQNLTNLDGLNSLTSVGGDEIEIKDNPDLSDISGLSNIETIHDNVFISVYGNYNETLPLNILNYIHTGNNLSVLYPDYQSDDLETGTYYLYRDEECNNCNDCDDLRYILIVSPNRLIVGYTDTESLYTISYTLHNNQLIYINTDTGHKLIIKDEGNDQYRLYNWSDTNNEIVEIDPGNDTYINVNCVPQMFDRLPAIYLDDGVYYLYDDDDNLRYTFISYKQKKDTEGQLLAFMYYKRYIKLHIHTTSTSPGNEEGGTYMWDNCSGLYVRETTTTEAVTTTSPEHEPCLGILENDTINIIDIGNNKYRIKFHGESINDYTNKIKSGWALASKYLLNKINEEILNIYEYRDNKYIIVDNLYDLDESKGYWVYINEDIYGSTIRENLGTILQDFIEPPSVTTEQPSNLNEGWNLVAGNILNLENIEIYEYVNQQFIIVDDDDVFIADPFKAYWVRKSS